MKLKKISNFITERDDTSTMVSETKGGNYIIQCLKNFQKNHSVPHYQRISIGILAVISINFISNLAFVKFSCLPWDNTSQVYNPITDIMNMMRIQDLTLQSIVSVDDLTTIQDGGADLNMSMINSYFGISNYT
jgi:hypothetical protein